MKNAGLFVILFFRREDFEKSTCFLLAGLSNRINCRDKGKYLGIIRSGENTFRIYSVKGDEESQYIYRLWDWEGAFYKKIEQGDCDEKENF